MHRAWLAPMAIALTICGGCDTSESAAPAAGLTRNEVSASWISPTARSEDLLYVTNYAAGTVSIYSYARRVLVGQLGPFESPGAPCVDRAQDVYIPGGYGHIIAEYRHGGTKAIRSLVDANGVPFSCAVDWRTGDLAVVNGVAVAGGEYGVLVYRGGSSVAAFYTNSSLPYYFFCAYDPDGNLYVNGKVSSFDNGWLALLRRGSGTLTPLSLKYQFGYPGSLQWNDGFLVMGDPQATRLDRLTIKGNKATLKGWTTVEGGSGVPAFWIDGAFVVGGNYAGDDVLYWSYPGGDATSATINAVSTPQGVVVSRSSQ